MPLPLLPVALLQLLLLVVFLRYIDDVAAAAAAVVGVPVLDGRLLIFCVSPEVDTLAAVTAIWDMGQGMRPTTDHCPVEAS